MALAQLVGLKNPVLAAWAVCIGIAANTRATIAKAAKNLYKAEEKIWGFIMLLPMKRDARPFLDAKTNQPV